MPSVPEGLTLAGITKQLEEAKGAGKITSYVVTGVQRDSHNEIFLLSILFSMAGTKWGTESDLVTAIDWPAKTGGPAPRGRVTVRIDRRGAASAELIAAGPVPAVPQTNFAADREKVKAFGFASVTGWSDAAEISKVLAALELLKTRAPQNISALKGVELIRVSTLTNARNEAGEFFAGDHVALGAGADVKPYLKLADLAFPSSEVQFFGGGRGSPTVPAVFQTILHEVGHAVEKEELRQAQEGLVEARAEVEAAGKVLAVDSTTYAARLQKATKDGKQALKKFYDEQKATYDKNVAAKEDALKREGEASDKLKDTSATSGHTKRLQKFIDLVKTGDIRRFTQYSADNWPGHPEEFYAEAYSLWLVDPAFLSINYRVVYNFFQSGDYLR
ncbi:MAG: hypothetical protein ACRDS0_01530 [Pseudonocardiaceae bacterium]